MARTLCVLACLVVFATAAPVEERFLPHFITEDTDVAAASAGAAEASASAAVNARPIIVNPSSPSKKVQISITKEFIKGNHAGAGGASAHAQASAHGHHAKHVPAAAPAPAPAQLHLDNSPVVIDNETMAGILQELLAGNIQNVQAHGQPLALPPGGKPVAVIFSAAMHVVDLGNLQPAKAPAEALQARHRHNHTQHAAVNHTSILESIMSPLMSLTHMGGHANVATSVPVSPSVAQPMQMQPVIVMMPVPQRFQTVGAAPNSAWFDSSAQLNEVLQGILNAKKQVLASSPNAHSPRPLATSPLVAAHTVEAPVVAAAESPVVAVPRIKKTHISITKTKVI